MTWPFTYAEALRAASDASGLRPEVITGQGRWRAALNARKGLMVGLHRSGWSYMQIARRMGFDHTTIMHAVKVHTRNPREEVNAIAAAVMARAGGPAIDTNNLAGPVFVGVAAI